LFYGWQPHLSQSTTVSRRLYPLFIRTYINTTSSKSASPTSPEGAGVVLGGIANGRLMDYSHTAIAKRIGHTVDKVSGDDMNHFPIERARARGSWLLLGIYNCALAGSGWAVQTHAHKSIPLILQFVLGALCTCFQQTFNALLVTIFPGSPSTAAASRNITRCVLSAVVVAIMQSLVDVMGSGWFFTMLTFVSGVGGLATVWAIQTRGMKWRGQKNLESW